MSMAEGFENLDNILRDWGKIRCKKVLMRHCNWTGTRVWKKKEKAVSFLENDSEKKKKTRIVSVGSRASH